MKQIQWFPGHMAKAKREISEKLKLVDIVFELLDARIPVSSSNPEVAEITKGLPRIVLLNKASLADPKQTALWINDFKEKGIEAIPIDALTGENCGEIYKRASVILKPLIDKEMKRGLKQRSIRALIIGIPNCGKSTLINKLASRKVAKTGDKPGVTLSQQWIHVNDHFDIMDTPGILWPKFDNLEVGYKLALVGSIKDDILEMDDMIIYGLRFLEQNYKERLIERYQIQDLNMDDILDVYNKIGLRRGCLCGKEIDYERVNRLVLMDLRSQKFGRITLDYYGRK